MRPASAIALALSTLVTCAPSSGAEAPAQRHGSVVDTTARTLVMTAMQSELDAVLAHATIDRVETVAGRAAHVGIIAGIDVVAMASGMSMVNAAITTQEALHHFEVERMVVSGIAGGPNRGIEIGDVTVPASWAQYQENAFSDDERRNEGLGRFGMMHPRRVGVTRSSDSADEERFWFHSDPALVAAARRIAHADTVPLERCNLRQQCARETSPRILVGGRGVSGPTFVDHAGYTEWVWNTFAPDALEMETAAYAHVAYTSDVPFVAVRAISDLAGGNPENLVGHYGRMAARNAAAVTAALLADLEANPPVPPDRRVALTFDDLPTVAAGPGPDADRLVTEGILDHLRDAGAPAIAFVNEGKLYGANAGSPDPAGVARLQAWIDAGHLLGNHTYSHAWMYEVGADAFVADLERGERVWRPMMEAAGHEQLYLRHPRLNTGRTREDRDRVRRYLADAGYVEAPVSIDNNDFLFANAYARSLTAGETRIAARIAAVYLDYMEEIVAYYEEQARTIVGYELPQILLLHANRLNADTLDELLSMLRRRGYRFIDFEEALEDPAYARMDDFVGRAGITWLHRWAITEGRPGSTYRGEPPVPEWILEVGSGRN